MLLHFLHVACWINWIRSSLRGEFEWSCVFCALAIITSGLIEILERLRRLDR